MVKHLCALEYSSVELQLRHKYYALAAAACLLKYVEFIENIIYAPKVSTVKLGDKEHFEKEQIDVKELFPMAKC